MKNATLILNSEKIDLIITRLAYEIYEHYYDSEELIILGIEKYGFNLAKKILDQLKIISPIKYQLYSIKLNKKNLPLSKIDFDPKQFSGKEILIVDDVMNTGRVLYYTAGLFHNQPVKSVNTLVLINRNHPKFPVFPRFNGMQLSTTLKDHVEVTKSSKGFKAYLK